MEEEQNLKKEGSYPSGHSQRGYAAALLKMGYRLKIYDAYRPQMAVDHFVRWAADVSDTLMKPYFYPKVPRNRLFELGYIAKRSGHTRGSTVDLTLFDMRTEKEVDMGGTFDWFGINLPTIHDELLKELVAGSFEIVKGKYEKKRK